MNSFIGFTSYYRKFTSDYASIATPLTNALHKKQPERVTWSDECGAVFKKLYATLATAPLLKVPEANKPLAVYLDA